MAKTKIEWADFSSNPIKGLCPMDCKDLAGKPYCYARRLYDRFGWDPTIRYDPWVMMDLPVEPSRIFVGSTMELFGPWVKPGYVQEIQRMCESCWPQHTFIFLTKMPENLPKEWPNNCWVGATATNAQEAARALGLFNWGGINAPVRFLSMEPLLNWEVGNEVWEHWFKDIEWLILGQCTPVSKRTAPVVCWIDEIEEACKKAGVPYFEKDNLMPLLQRELRQEFPGKEGYGE